MDDKSLIKKFKRDLHGEVTIDAVTRYLQSIGYTVVFYQQGVDNDYLLINNLADYSNTVPAFTFCGNGNKYVFVDSSQSADDRLCSLLHEAGHILLGHVDKQSVTYNTRRAEMQAEAFAYAVLQPSSNKVIEIGIVIILAIVMFCAPFAVYHVTHNVTVVSDNADTTDNDIVYVTATGTKYHRKNCIYTKDKDCTAVARSEAEQSYKPCAVCNP